ncbi:hypothetical protein CSHISOI_05952 [Colletotrichum shisoi]|uniref:Microsomal glutathione S-transferase 3 n=1 Tax=Colletotrichum shisoi TaxID=2078593 RepID=A0A5Q4BT83_9PEZI|nr:hypothetical protein CSHISOI_05952 [Colletotrichum shisoi]
MGLYPDLDEAHLSYYSVPVAYMLAFIPHVYANTLAGPNYDISEPRKLLETVPKSGNQEKKVYQRIRRAKAAHDNAIETMGLFAAGVAVANLANTDKRFVNTLSLGYLGLRALYTLVYVKLQDNRKWAPVRTLTWVASMGIIFALWIQAGNAMN